MVIHNELAGGWSSPSGSACPWTWRTIGWQWLKLLCRRSRRRARVCTKIYVRIYAALILSACVFMFLRNSIMTLKRVCTCNIHCSVLDFIILNLSPGFVLNISTDKMFIFSLTTIRCSARFPETRNCTRETFKLNTSWMNTSYKR